MTERTRMLHIEKADILEISWVTHPANLYCRILSVKDADGREVYTAPNME